MTCLSLTFSSRASALLWTSAGALYRWTDLLAEQAAETFPPVFPEDQHV